MAPRPARRGHDQRLDLPGGAGARVKTDRSGGVQYGALPWRTTAAGTVEIMLITSRETHRWVIPKGWPMDGRTPAEAAAAEAYEEAGLRGPLQDAIGTFVYAKRLKDLVIRDLTVEVFPMRVEGELAFWPEAQMRRRRWFSLEAAANAVDEPDLARIIRSFQPQAVG